MFWGINLWWEAPEINQSKEARGPELPSTAAEFQQFIWITCWRNLSLHWLDKEPRKACDLSLNIQTILVLCWLQGWVGFFFLSKLVMNTKIVRENTALEEALLRLLCNSFSSVWLISMWENFVKYRWRPTDRCHGELNKFLCMAEFM